jgi:hypothetical protein
MLGSLLPRPLQRKPLFLTYAVTPVLVAELCLDATEGRTVTLKLKFERTSG